MQGRTLEEELVPFNPEIKAICHKNNASQKKQKQQERQTRHRARGASSYQQSTTLPFILEEPTISIPPLISKKPQMEEEDPLRVTLED